MVQSKRNKRIGVAAACTFLLAGALHAQQASPAPEDSFTLDAAILDTSIPFAVGAHEARQELRGAFGWPTFQEGLVQGVYFRFDPDGYARFSPTPRLDTDVFEVICRPRTHVCMARKGGLTLTLNNRNQIQLQLENVTEADEFLISEGISELPIPNNILQPMDARMELLLSSGGDLVVSRAKEEVERISLKGFAAVTAYLRWVVAQQSYTVLPRDWPIPNSGVAKAEITKPVDWASPMPKPLSAPSAIPDAEVAEVRGELRILRELLLKGENDTVPAGGAFDKVVELQQALDTLAREIEGLKSPQVIQNPAPEVSIPTSPTASTVVDVLKMDNPETENSAQLMARRMEYLMTEIGLEPEVALMLLQQGDIESAPEAMETQDSVVDTLLAELRAQLPEAPATEVKSTPQSVVTQQEYILLSDYFRSVFQQN